MWLVKAEMGASLVLNNESELLILKLKGSQANSLAPASINPRGAA